MKYKPSEWVAPEGGGEISELLDEGDFREVQVEFEQVVGV